MNWIISFPSVTSSFYAYELSCSLKILFLIKQPMTMKLQPSFSTSTFTTSLCLWSLVVEGGIHWGFDTFYVVVALCLNYNSQVLADSIQNLECYFVVSNSCHLRVVGTEQSILIWVYHFHGWYYNDLSGQHWQTGLLPNLLPLILVCSLICVCCLLGNVQGWVLYFVVVDI